tara:strand:- start:868 stop:1050 length:183 start_codon:yes stop_codon:yes gene_type:complete
MTTVLMNNNGISEMEAKEYKRYCKIAMKIAELEKQVSGINAIIQELHIELFKIERGISDE